MTRAALLLLLASLGYAAATINAAYLTLPWIHLRLREIVGRWLSIAGLDAINRVWGIVWMYVPEWSIALTAGVVIRVLFGKRSPSYVLAFCFGLVLIPGIEFLVDRENWPISPTVTMVTMLWSLICFPISLLAYALPYRGKHAAVLHGGWRYSILQLLTITFGFAVLAMLVVHARLIGLPCFLLGSLTWFAYTVIRRRNRESSASQPSAIAEP